MNIVPGSYINNTLTRYFSEEGKPTLLDLARDNIVIVILGVIVIISMLLLIIAQNRIIQTEKRAKEHRRIEMNRLPMTGSMSMYPSEWRGMIRRWTTLWRTWRSGQTRKCTKTSEREKRDGASADE